MNCPVCGTPVKVVGKTTQHYEPIRLSKERIEKICFDHISLGTSEYYKMLPRNLAQAIYNAINKPEGE